MKTIHRKKAFTLPELLIGMIIILLVMGGVVAMLRSGLDLFIKAEANGKVTTGVRFTVASFKSDILPMVNKSSSIEILKNMDGVPAKVTTSADCYVYLSTDHTVKCRSAAGDETLKGSEYISSIDFTVPVSSADTVDNYMLNMHIDGQDPNHLLAYTSVDVVMALFNKPDKSNTSNKDASGKNYTGSVLHFAAFEFKDLQVRDASADYKVLANNESVAKDDVLQLFYKISVPAGKKDATKLMWYASSQYSSTVTKSTGYYENTSYTLPSFSTTSGDHYWPLLVKTSSGYYLASELYKSIDVLPDTSYLEIPTSDDYFYVYTGSSLPGKSSTGDFDANGKLTDSTKVTEFGKYCYLRCWVVPSYSDKDGSAVVYPDGYQQWSHIIRIQNTGSAGQAFFNEWVQDMHDRADPATYKANAEHWQSNRGDVNATGHITPSTGEYYATIEGPKGSNLIQLAKALRPDHFSDARKYDIAVDGKSYTCVTNYSIIIDAEAGKSTAGIGLLLNGYRNSGQTSGYVFYYDPGANGFPIRLQYTKTNQTDGNIVGGYKAWGVNEIESPLQADVVNSIAASNITNRTDGSFYSQYYNPQYVPAALQNNIYNNAVESTTSTLRGTIGDKTNECHELQKRHRYMLTILEYYNNSAGNQYPLLLVRMKLLRPINDVKSGDLVLEKGATTLYNTTEKALRVEDPFLMGPKFYYSEPAWYGLFVGQTPKSGNSSFTFKAMRADAATVSVVRSKDTTNSSGYYDSGGRYYAVQTPASTKRYTSGYTVNDGDWVYGYYKSNYPRYRNVYPNSGAIGDADGGRSDYYDYYTSYGYYTWVNGYYNGDSKVFNGGIYKGTLLSPRSDLAAANSSYATAAVLGTLTPDRNHWLGIALWGGNTTNDRSSIIINNMTLAPGFDESELRSIMFSGSKVFGIDETKGSYDTVNAQYSETTDTGKLWNKALFGSNAYSDGTGNTSQGNIYKNRFTNASGTKEACVMSLQHTGTKSDGSDCDCPMCRRYKTYQTNPIKFW